MSSEDVERFARRYQEALRNINALKPEGYDALSETALRMVLVIAQQMVDALQRQQRFAQAALERKVVEKEREHAVDH